MTDRVTAAVQHRDSQAEAPASAAERRLKEYGRWFANILPPEMPAEAFMTLLSGVLRKDPKLAAAANANPGGLLTAATDCAQQGGVPGKTYHFTHFKNKETGVEDIVGMADYKLEIQQAYKSGLVAAVKCEVVYKGDHFRWAPNRMQVPEHEILDEERDNKNLRAVYAYAEMTNGSISKCVVMFRAEVMKHKDVARTKKFWEGAWEFYMWLKTAIHVLRRYIPESVTYQTQVMKAYTAAQRLGGQVLSDTAGEREIVPPPAPPALGNGGEPAGNTLRQVTEPDDEEPPWPGDAIPAEVVPLPEPPDPGQGARQDEPAGTEDGTRMTRSTGGRISHMFADSCGWKGEDYRDRRLIVAGILGAPKGQPRLRLISPMAMTEAQALQAETLLARIITAATEADRNPGDDLQKLHDAALAASEPGEGEDGS